MKTITSLIIFLLTLNILVCQNNKNRELANFFNDVLSDDYHYTYKDYLKDSVGLIETAIFDFEFQYLKEHIDTIDSKYMLYTGYGKMHFDTIFIVSEPDRYYFFKDEKNKLTKLLSKDTIFGISNPFSKQTVRKCIRYYNVNRRKVKLGDYINANFIKPKELDKLFRQEGGWEEFYKIYQKEGFITMTIPIFTLNNEYAYFEWSYNCGGLCGYGFAGIYKKQNGKWKAIKVITAWIS